MSQSVADRQRALTKATTTTFQQPPQQKKVEKMSVRESNHRIKPKHSLAIASSRRHTINPSDIRHGYNILSEDIVDDHDVFQRPKTSVGRRRTLDLAQQQRLRDKTANTGEKVVVVLTSSDGEEILNEPRRQPQPQPQPTAQSIETIDVIVDSPPRKDCKLPLPFESSFPEYNTQKQQHKRDLALKSPPVVLSLDLLAFWSLGDRNIKYPEPGSMFRVTLRGSQLCFELNGYLMSITPFEHWVQRQYEKYGYIFFKSSKGEFGLKFNNSLCAKFCDALKKVSPLREIGANIAQDCISTFTAHESFKQVPIRTNLSQMSTQDFTEAPAAITHYKSSFEHTLNAYPMALQREQISNSVSPDVPWAKKPPRGVIVGGGDRKTGKRVVVELDIHEVGDESGLAVEVSGSVKRRNVDKNAIMTESANTTEYVNAVVLVYPASGPNSVTLHDEDLSRLQEKEFLNDTLIEFYIRYTTLSHNPTPATSTPYFHIYNTFFYAQLTAKDDAGKRLSPQDCYSRVKRWTKRVNVFDCDFLIVPINEHVHWYLAVIWDPKAFLKSTEPTGEDAARRGKENGCRLFVFDSLHGRHTQTGKVLGMYLKMEAMEKLGREVVGDTISIVHAKVQGQMNYCDCGVFLLHYISTMLRMPDLVAQAVLKGDGLNTPQFGTLQEIRAMRQFMKEKIAELKELAQNAP